MENVNSIALDESVMMKEKNTKHQNFITAVKIYAKQGDKVAMITTSDINGYINYWNTSSL